MLFAIYFQFSCREIQENQKQLELNGTRQLLVYVEVNVEMESELCIHVSSAECRQNIQNSLKLKLYL